MKHFVNLLTGVLQRLSFVTIILVGLALLGYTIASALGLTPWLKITAFFGETPVDIGIYAQVGLTALFVMLGAYLPTNKRIMELETSHRNFHMGMRDVAQAYAIAHRSDREGVFTLKGEFDSIRERILFLRDHPDLADLEPSVIEVAAQMSHVSAELADTYSDAKVARARDFLVARQQEIEDFNIRIERAKAAALEIRHWHAQVDMEESVIEAQLARLRDEFADILPAILETKPEPAPELTEAEVATNVTRFDQRAAE